MFLLIFLKLVKLMLLGFFLSTGKGYNKRNSLSLSNYLLQVLLN